MSFSFYKTEAGKVTQQVGLHGIPLSNFSSLFSHQALPTATLWNQHLVMLPPALACSLALWSPASDTGGPSKQLTAAAEGQLSTSSLFNSHLLSTCNSSYSKSWDSNAVGPQVRPPSSVSISLLGDSDADDPKTVFRKSPPKTPVCLQDKVLLKCWLKWKIYDIPNLMTLFKS